MKITFQCDQCGKELNAESQLIGRLITCPFCRGITTIHAPSDEPSEGSSELSSFEQASPEQGETTFASATSSTPNEGNASCEFNVDPPSNSPHNAVREVNAERDLAAMSKICPNFKPNPFGASFPLDVALENCDVPESDNDASGQLDDASGVSYDVDELIKGVE